MKLSTISIMRLSKCEPDLQRLAYEASKDAPYEFVITSGFRSISEQQKLFAQGRTELGKIVTKCDGLKVKSKHNYLPAKAFDIAIKIDDQLTWEKKYYDEMAIHFKKIAGKLGIKIKWGGNFQKYDGPHYEI